MSQPNGNKDPRDLAPELPPVEPPTAGFIVQLFVIPAIVVAVVVVVWLLFGKLAGGERDVMDYVRTIRSENVNRRWRAAYELSSLVQNDERLARDPALLGELTALLDTELDRPRDEDPEGKLAQYLALALGAFQTNEARTESGRKVDPTVSLARALDSRYPMTVRVAAALSLGRLGAQAEGGLDAPDAVRALVAALNDAPPGRRDEADVRELRQRAAYSLGYLSGDEADAALRKVVAGDEDRIVRYNAAVALARRGDEAARPVLREMLSTADLRQVVEGATESESGRRIEAIELEALWALQASVDHGRPDLARSVRDEIDHLQREGVPAVRVEAGNLLKKIQVAG